MSNRRETPPASTPVAPAPAPKAIASPTYEEAYARAIALRDQRRFPAHRILDLFCKGAKDYTSEELSAIALELNQAEQGDPNG